jgi:hypothetical protein
MSRRLFAALAVCLAPLAVRAADEHPYKNVKVGDFATYKIDTKIAGIPVSGVMTRTVTAKSDKEATVKSATKLSFNGVEKELTVPDEKIPLDKPYDPSNLGEAGGVAAGSESKVEKQGKEKIKVAGKEYEAAWTAYKLKAKTMGQDIDADLKVWMSRDIPMGVARMELKAVIAKQELALTMELIETGTKKP